MILWPWSSTLDTLVGAAQAFVFLRGDHDRGDSEGTPSPSRSNGSGSLPGVDTMGNEAFQAFLDQVRKYPGMWDSIALRVVAARKGDTFFLLGLRGTLSVGEVEGVDVLFSTPDVILFQESRRASDIEQLLASLEQGTIELGDTPMQVDGFGRWKCQEFAGGGQSWVDEPLPHTMLHVAGRQVHEVADETDIDRRLRPWGYSSLQELCLDRLGFPVGRAYLTQIQFIMPIFLEASASFVEDQLRIELRYHCSLRLDDLRASYVLTGQRNGGHAPSRGQLRFSRPQNLEDQPGFCRASAEETLASDVTGATAYVFHTSREDPLYTLRAVKAATAKSNPVLSAMNFMAGKPGETGIQGCERVFRQGLGLENVGIDATKLEAATQNLMACAGYVCLFAGKILGTQGVDILAFSQDFAKCFAISVTASNKIGDKIRTLLPQRNKLQAELEGVAVVPLIFAPVAWDEVKRSDLQDAKAHNIGLMLLPELADLLTAVMTLPMQDIGAYVESAVSRSLGKLANWSLGLGGE